jgi:hypothetical protein
MAFFAVVKSSGSDFQVVECHLNVWCLRGLLGPVFFFDVGLRLRVTVGRLDDFKLSVPFGTDEIQDLSLLFRTPDLAAMVFGSPTQGDYPEIKYTNGSGQHTVRVGSIDAGKCSRDQTHSSSSYSCWTITPTPSLQPDPTADHYLRIRFPVRNSGKIWLWKKRWLARYGAIFDFRVSDVRGASSEEGWHVFERSIADIASANVLMIAPTDLTFNCTSPPLKYMRLFEGRLWYKYLGRLPGLRGSDRFFVYHWKQSDITSTNPFRVFIDLERHFTALPIINHLIIIALFILLVGASDFLIINGSRLSDIFHAYYLEFTAAGGGLLVIKWLAPKITLLREGWTRFAAGYRRVEGRIFEFIGKLSS